MAKSENQKLKLIYLRDILLKNTDEVHSITMAEIIAALDSLGISAERKSLYDDLELLDKYGLDIIKGQENRTFTYRVGSRPFELVELKLLVDCVQSAKFITTRKSNELIKKIEGLASKYEAGMLQRQVYVSERIKTMNESIYYNVDIIHSAITSNSEISFQYFQWDANKQMVLKHDGARYVISPWALCCSEDNYYLVAYDSEASKIKHFRVDKMLHIEKTDTPRKGRDEFAKFDTAVYSKKMFGMFDGEETVVRLECHNRFAGVIIDRFGKDIMIIPKDEEHFTTNVRVAVSNQFLGWIMGLGPDVKIVGPEETVELMRREIERLAGQYK